MNPGAIGSAVGLMFVFTLASLAGADGSPTDPTPGAGGLLIWPTSEPTTCLVEEWDSFRACMNYWNVEGPNDYSYEMAVYDNNPVITLDNHHITLDNKRFIAMHTVGERSWNNQGAVYAAEYYVTLDSAIAAYWEYFWAGYDTTDFGVTILTSGTAALYVTENYVARLPVTLQDRAIADLSWGESRWMKNQFHSFGATAVMVYEEQIPTWLICSNFDERWARFACEDPDISPVVLIANLLPEAKLWVTDRLDGFTNSIRLGCGCDNEAARVLDWEVGSDGEVVMLTNYERHSDGFEVYGVDGDTRVLLESFPATGDESDRIGVYRSKVDRFYPYYQVAEVDSARMYRTFSAVREPGESGSTPDDLRSFGGLRITDLGSSPTGAGPPLLSTGHRAVNKSGYHADVVVYTWNAAVAAPLMSQLTGQGLEAILYEGDGSATDIKSSYDQTYAANIAMNAQIGTDRYPIFPSPELYLVGKDSDYTVRTNTWPDSEGRCNQPVCRGDFDYTDVDGDGVPNGPVARLFVENASETARYVDYSEEYNASLGVAVRQALLCAGDYEVSGIYQAPAILLAAVDTLLTDEGFSTTWFRRSDYTSSSAATTAGTAMINAGVDQIWAVGGVASYQRIPSSVMSGVSYDASGLTTDQSFLLFAPGCEVAADWGFGAMNGLLITKLFTNTPGLGGCAGAAVHWSGGWDVQHEAWSQFLLEEYRYTDPGMSMAELVWRAVLNCSVYAPWMLDYARSAVYVGARTVLKEGYVSVDDTSEEESLPPGSLVLDVAPTLLRDTGCRVRYSVPPAGTGRLDVYDVSGRLVRSLTNGRVTAGMHVTRWDGIGSGGRELPSGVYFVRLSTDAGERTRKITILR